MKSYTILWAEYYNLKPISGVLTDSEGVRYYFSSSQAPTIISSLTGEILQAKKDFNVYSLDSEYCAQITEQHDKRCEENGQPRRHGDPIIIYRGAPPVIQTYVNQVQVEGLVDQIDSSQIDNYQIEPSFDFRTKA